MAEYRPILTPLAQYYVSRQDKKKRDEELQEEQRYNRALKADQRTREIDETQRRRTIEDERLAREREAYDYGLKTRLPADIVKEQQDLNIKQGRRADTVGDIDMKTKQMMYDRLPDKLRIEQATAKMNNRESQLKLQELERSSNMLSEFRARGLTPSQAEVALLSIYSFKQQGAKDEDILRLVGQDPKARELFGNDLQALRIAMQKYNEAEKVTTTKAENERKKIETAYLKEQNKAKGTDTGRKPATEAQIQALHANLIRALATALNPDSPEGKALKDKIREIEEQYPDVLRKQGKVTDTLERGTSTGNKYGDLLQRYKEEGKWTTAKNQGRGI